MTVDASEGPGSVDGSRLRQAMSRFATGVAVVTTVADRHDHAMTANSLTSVSLDPALLLFCVYRESGFREAVLDSGAWGVSLLGASARPAAAWLSTPGRPLHGQLGRVPHHRGVTGAALFDDALATMECRTTQTHEAGDHTIVIGKVVSVVVPDHPDDALLYYRSRYGTTR